MSAKAATKPATTAAPATSAASAAAPAAPAAAKGTAKPRAKPKSTKNKTVDSQVICESFASQVLDRYQLDETVMDQMKEVVRTVLNEYYIYREEPSVPTDDAATQTGGKSKKADGPKKPRKSSAYNLYVKDMMQDPEVKLVPQKEKMSIIGKKWQTLNEAGRAPYQARATELNANVGDDATTESLAQ
jgi:hypothetical protein